MSVWPPGQEAEAFLSMHCLPETMEEYMVAATALWPDNTSNVNAYCKAVSVTCLELGFHLSNRGNLSCKVVNLNRFTGHKALLQSALREIAAPEDQKVSKAVKTILPAAIFTVGPTHIMPCGIELNLMALKAAAPVSCSNIVSCFSVAAQHVLAAFWFVQKMKQPAVRAPVLLLTRRPCFQR